jgi:hypothetical protein
LGDFNNSWWNVRLVMVPISVAVCNLLLGHADVANQRVWSHLQVRWRHYSLLTLSYLCTRGSLKNCPFKGCYAPHSHERSSRSPLKKIIPAKFRYQAATHVVAYYCHHCHKVIIIIIIIAAAAALTPPRHFGTPQRYRNENTNFKASFRAWFVYVSQISCFALAWMP